MEKALCEARVALDKNEVPIGAVIISEGRIISKSHNLVESLRDVSAHAEMQSITSASEFLGGKYLTDCSLYVTLEPCVMCAGALYWSKITRVIFGAYDPKNGFLKKGLKLHPKTEIVGGVIQEKCLGLLRDFFETKRS